MVKDGWGSNIFCWAPAILLPDDLLFQIPKTAPSCQAAVRMVQVGLSESLVTKELIRDGDDETLSMLGSQKKASV